MDNPEIINEYNRLHGDVINAVKHLSIELKKHHEHVVKTNPKYHNIENMRNTRQKLIEAINAFNYTEARFIDETIIKMRLQDSKEQKEQNHKVTNITIANDHLNRKVNITITLCSNGERLIKFYPEEGMQHTDHIFDPRNPKSVKEAAEVLANFFEESSIYNSIHTLNLIKRFGSPEDQCPVCDEEGLEVKKYHEDGHEVIEVYCANCGYESRY